MKRLMTIMMAVVIAMTSVNVASVKKASAATQEMIEKYGTAYKYEEGDTLLWKTDSAYIKDDDPCHVAAILKSDGKTIRYYSLKSDGNIDHMNAEIVLRDDGFAECDTPCWKKTYKVLENNNYRLKFEDENGTVMLMDESHYFYVVSTCEWRKADWVLEKTNIDTEIVTKWHNRFDSNDIEKVSKGHKIAFTLNYLGKRSDKYDGYDRVTTWTSSDPSIATVDSKGVVTGKKYGIVTITAKLGSSEPATMKVKVVKNEYNGHANNNYAYIKNAKFDKKGNLVCKITARKRDRVYRKYTFVISDKMGNRLFTKNINISKAKWSKGTKKFVIKKKYLKKHNVSNSTIDLVNCRAYVEFIGF